MKTAKLVLGESHFDTKIGFYFISYSSIVKTNKFLALTDDYDVIICVEYQKYNIVTCMQS